ncbi:putative Multidrug-efflux transporter [Pseudomonas sp. Os17]|uniref:MATE family efflux transporter n=1 Tax=Pseudomonas sp. Os17 TaxID=1500686 RepID=UPI0005FC9B63|nr:MATE family efflux transporter [Pseudomonas sp. Os17]BAQ75376.1 putative Multidrug-efflux transporter [Pseudomonas sp. Os17]
MADSSLLKDKLLQLSRLSGPIVVSRIGFLLLSLVDTMMVGRYATESLAAISITHAIADTYMLIAAGLLLGILVMGSIAIGQQDPRAAGLAAQRGVVQALGLGLLCALASVASLPLLSRFGVQADLAAAIAQLMGVVALGLPAILIYIAYSFFLEGISRPMPATLVILGGNLINGVLCYAMVYGAFGLPEMGALGSAWCTTLVRLLMALAIVLYVHRFMADRADFGINRRFAWGWSQWQMQRRIGYGGGLSFGIEAGAFMLIAVMAGVASPLIAAACAVLVNIRSILFMIPMGVGFATSILVGMAHGNRDLPDIQRSTQAGLWLGVSLSTLCALLLGALPGPLLAQYSHDAQLLAAALSSTLLLALALPFDAWQGVMSNALRGREDALAPTLIHGIAYLLLMVPLGWLLTLHWQRGLNGLVEAMLIGNLVAAALMTQRHYQLNRRAAQAAPAAALRDEGV